MHKVARFVDRYKIPLFAMNIFFFMLIALATADYSEYGSQSQASQSTAYEN